MVLHIFNPEHDIALAANLENFTSPHAGRQLRRDLGFLPALWAVDGDAVLVDNPEAAANDLRHIIVQARKYLRIDIAPKVTFLPSRILSHTPSTVENLACQIPSIVDEVAPWGWDLALRAQLRRRGINEVLLPTDDRLGDIRVLSHRRTAARLMQLLLADELEGITGEIPDECSTLEEVEEALSDLRNLTSKIPYNRNLTSKIPYSGHTAVLKAPWSSSGRGLRFVDVRSDDVGAGPVPARTETADNVTTPLPNSPTPSPSRGGEGSGYIVRCFSGLEVYTPLLPAGGAGGGASGGAGGSAVRGWLRGVLSRQGSVMVEPYYNKVKDLAMEFEALADGSVRYCGLSLFHTANGQYTGNIVATEQRKRAMLARYLPLAVLDSVRDRICHHLADLLEGRYQGPLGIDMMVVNPTTVPTGEGSGQAPGSFPSQERHQGWGLLHPCVEINLRRTMGHVALALTPADDDLVGVMRIAYRNDKSKVDISLSPLHRPDSLGAE